MMAEHDDAQRGPKPDTTGFLVFLVLAAIVGGALVLGVRFLLGWLQA